MFIDLLVTPSLVLMDYVDRKSLNNEQLVYLEQVLKASIQKLKFNGREPVIANDKICDAALIFRGSYEISCIASILDTLLPTKKAMERKTKVFNALCYAGLLVTD
tara:strand:- start:335 stop:649 length:315 start_codon:yes stop_codon:yes gene_type:complete